MGIVLALHILLGQSLPPPSLEVEVAGVEIRLPRRAEAKLRERAAAVVSVRPMQRLSLRAVQRSIQGLYATGFADVEVHVEPRPGGSVVVFDVALKDKIDVVRYEGLRALSLSDVQSQAKLEIASEYWPEKVAAAAEAVRTFGVRRGYPSMVVDSRVSGQVGEVTVELLITEGKPLRLTGYQFAGDTGLQIAQLMDAMPLSVGQVLDQERVQEGVERLRALYRNAGFYRARVDTPVTQPDGTVLVPLSAGPRYSLTFTGNRSISTTALEAVVGYSGQETLDETVSDRLVQRITRVYQLKGYLQAQVQARELRQGRLAELRFVIDEGSPVRIVEHTFVGNRAVTSSELVGLLRASIEAASPSIIGARALADPLELEGRGKPVVGAAFPSPPAESVFDDEAWRQALKAMKAVYKDRGYLLAEVSLDSVELLRGQGRALFRVDEGPRAAFGTLSTSGLPAGFSSKVLNNYRSGGIFRVSALTRLEQGLAQELGRQGYLFAKVEGSYSLDIVGQRADCRLLVKPGPKVTVRRVVPVGNVRTSDEILLRQAVMAENQMLDSDALVQTQNNLLNLGIFRSVQVELLDSDTPEPLKTVLLKVKEYPTTDVGFSGGYFVADGVRVAADGRVVNVGGAGWNITGRVQLNLFALSAPALSGFVAVEDVQALETLGGRGNIAVDKRGLLPGGIGFHFDIAGERVFRPQFRFTRFAGGPSLDWSKTLDVGFDWARPRLTLLAQYELDWSRVTDTRRSTAATQALPTSLADQERLRFLFGTFFLQTVRFSPTFDARDNALTPHQGFLLQATAEWTAALFSQDLAGTGVPVSFLKLSGLASVYVPLAPSLVLAVSARAGQIVPLLSGSVTPPVKRFYLGGVTSMRGFNEDQLLAQDVRAQYRQDVRDCAILATKVGCTAAAQTLAQQRQVPSQGGELFAVVKAEARVPVGQSVELAGFFEAGNLFLAAPEDGFPLRTIAGAGVRYLTPIGPLALDLGFNLAPDMVVNEPPVVLHFNIGVF